MISREQVEDAIRAVLATETSAVRFSNALFTPGGLFRQLFTTPAEKKAVIDSPLFAEAQRRLSDLQRAEAARLVRPPHPVVVATAARGQLERLEPSDAPV